VNTETFRKNRNRVTIADVAHHAGVSKMTVSRVINQKGEITEATRRKVLDAMDELGFRPNRIARSLATDKTLRIGLVVPSLTNQYFGAILEGAEILLWEHGYHILLCHTGGDPNREQAVMDIFEDHRVDGVIVLSASSSSEAMNECLSRQRAAVVINTEVDPQFAARIYTDEIKSMALAVNHLIESGRRHLGYVHFDIHTYANHERYRGFEAALKNAGFAFDAEKQTRATQPYDPTMTQVISELLQTDPKIDGLVCFNSGIAARALQACAQLGRRVPDDVAVIGYDDIFMAELTIPSLTTVDLELPKEEVGALAAQMLLKRIENDDIQQEDVILEHKLIVRGSAP